MTAPITGDTSSGTGKTTGAALTIWRGERPRFYDRLRFRVCDISSVNDNVIASFDLDSNRPQSDDAQVGAEVLHDTTGSRSREDCWRKRSGASIAVNHELHAGSGPRGSHQLGKTPIRPFPTRAVLCFNEIGRRAVLRAICTLCTNFACGSKPRSCEQFGRFRSMADLHPSRYGTVLYATVRFSG